MQCKEHMNMHISNAINQCSWACSPYLCAYLVQDFWSFSFLQCCSLFVHVHVLSLSFVQSKDFHIFYILVQSFPHGTISPPYLSYHIISLYNFSPFVINFHKRYASYWCKGVHFGVDGWDLNRAFLMDITWLLEWHYM